MEMGEAAPSKKKHMVDINKVLHQAWETTLDFGGRFIRFGQDERYTHHSPYQDTWTTLTLEATRLQNGLLHNGKMLRAILRKRGGRKAPDLLSDGECDRNPCTDKCINPMDAVYSITVFLNVSVEKTEDLNP